MKTKKLLRDIAEITAETKALIVKIGMAESARRCGQNKSTMSKFVNGIHTKPIEDIIEIYERLK